MPRQRGVQSVVQECRSLCRQRGSKKYAKTMEKYFKHVLPMHGLKAEQIRKIYKVHPTLLQLDHSFSQEVAAGASVKEWNFNKIFDAATELLSSEYFEEKGVGICFLKDRTSELNRDSIDRLSPIVESCIYDWGTCDSFANGVLRHAILSDASIVQSMIQWSASESLWKRRASCVAFVPLAKTGNFNKSILEICENAVQMNERFVQLGVGWLLREFSLADREQMLEFLKTYSKSISREGLRYALEKTPQTLRKEMMDYHKNAKS